MFEQPAVGSTVSVTTKTSSYVIGRLHDINNYKNVKVLQSEKFDKPNTFRVSANEPFVSIRVIALSNVDQLLIDGKQAKESTQSNELKTIKIMGSKGSIYAVLMRGEEAYSCDCKGYSFRKTCRHLTEAMGAVDL